MRQSNRLRVSLRTLATLLLTTTGIESACRATIAGQGRVVDRSAQDRSTSEGQAYAMFFALVTNDRVQFDKTPGVDAAEPC